jgi:hypothetical protein
MVFAWNRDDPPNGRDKAIVTAQSGGVERSAATA